MDRRADPLGVPRPERGHPFGPRLCVAVGKPALHPGRRGVAVALEPAVQVRRVEQGDPDARIAGGGEQRRPHLVRIRVRRAVGLVVEVVELADTGDPGQRHLGERRAGEPVVAVRLEAASRGVHLLPPRPERASAGLRSSAKGAMERVAVHVGEAGDRETGQPDRVGGGLGSGGDRPEPSGRHLDRDRSLRLAVDQGELAPVALSRSQQSVRAAPSRIGIVTPRWSATSIARS